MTAESWQARPSSAVALVLGGVVALTTTGCPSYYWEAQAYFANTTREPVTLRVLELRAEADCPSLSGRFGEALARRELFGDGKTYEVLPGEALPLSLGVDPWQGGSFRRCAVLLQLLGQPDQVVAWPQALTAETETKLAPVKDERFRRVSVRLEGAAPIQGLAVGDALEVTPLPPASTADGPKESSPPSFGWSGLASSSYGVRLYKRETLPDGCLSLEVGPSRNETSTLYLCLPDWAFPFQVDEVLDVLAQDLPSPALHDGTRGSVARHLSLVAASPRRRLELWLNASANQPNIVQAASSSSRNGYRTPCGGYADPLSVALAPDGAPLRLGEVSDRQSTGYRRRALLGRADVLLVAPDACGDDYGALGARFDLLTLEEGENTP